MAWLPFTGCTLARAAYLLVGCNSASMIHAADVRSVAAICFDLDDTLWDFMPVIERAEAELRGFFAQQYPELLAVMHPEWMSATRARVLERFPERSHDFSFLR